MNSWGTDIFLFIVVSIIAGIAYAAKGGGVNKGISGAKDSLKQKGINLDASGVSIKTDRRAPTRDEYIVSSLTMSRKQCLPHPCLESHPFLQFLSEQDRTRASFAKSSEHIMAHKDAFTTTAGERQKQQEQDLKKRKLQQQQLKEQKRPS